MRASILLVTFLVAGGLLAAVATSRLHARRGRRYVRLRIAPYRTDRATAEAVVRLFDELHKRLLQRWWRRLRVGQPSVSLEAHLVPGPGGTSRAELAVSCPEDQVTSVAAVLRTAYPNTQLAPFATNLARPPYVLRLKKCSEFITRLRVPDQREPVAPLMDRVLAAMAATGGPCLVQLALTPTPAWFERAARQQFKRREERASPRHKDGERQTRSRTSEVDAAMLRGALDVQHRPCSSGSCGSWPRPGPGARTSPRCCVPAARRTSWSSGERPSAKPFFAPMTGASGEERAIRCRAFSGAYTPRPS